MVVREVLDNGLRLITETMPHVRSVTIGVWLTRGSRHESTSARAASRTSSSTCSSRAPTTRSAEDIAQAIDSIGGQLDAFTAKEYASYYIKVLDEHLPLAVDLLSDIVLRPAFAADEIEREKKVILEEIKMVEDTPDDLVHELFTQHFWEGHPLGRPILGIEGDGRVVHRRIAARLLRQRLRRAEPDRRGGRQPRSRAASAIWSSSAFATLPATGERVDAATRRTVVPQVITRTKELEQSHICLGTTAIRRTTTIATSATS